MRAIGRWIRRCWYFLNRRRLAADLAREMSWHRAQLPDSRRFGDVTRLRERSADVWGWTWFDDFVREIRFGFRQFRRAPKYVALVLAVLTAGAGVAMGVVHLANAAYFHPLLVEDANTLVRLGRVGDWHPTLPYVAIRYYAEHARTVSFVVAEQRGVVVSLNDDPRPQDCAFVSSNYFGALKIRAPEGRLFGKQDGDAPVAVLGYRTWKREFNGEVVTGQVIRVNRMPVTIVGVLPEDFDGLAQAGEGRSNVAIWLPVELRSVVIEQSASLDDVTQFDTAGYAALRPGVPIDAASGEVDSLRRGWLGQTAQEDRSNRFEVTPVLRAPRLEGDVAFLFVLVGLVFVSACGNLAGLSMARGLARHDEMRLRVALGASRARLFRQLITENAVLAIVGCVLGSIAGYWTGQLLRSLSSDLPAGLHIVFDAPMAIATMGFVVIAIVGFGLYPAAKVLGSRPATGRIRRIFVGLQVAASCALLTLSALTWRSGQRLASVEPTIDYRHIVIVDPQLAQRHLDVPHERALLSDMQSRLTSAPGVANVTIGTEGRLTRPTQSDSVLTYEVDSSYLRDLGIAITRGRPFTNHEDHVVVVSESAARMLWPTEDPLGRTWSVGRGTPAIVVGVARDTRSSLIGGLGVGEAYLPVGDDALKRAVILVRTQSDPSELFRRARDLVSASGVTPTVRMMTRTSADSNTGGDVLLRTLGVVAVALAFVGVFGFVAFIVSQRTREIGIRMALGADRRDVVITLLRSQASTLVGGLAAGLAVATAGRLILGSQLYGVSGIDPVSQLAGATSVCLVALLGAIVPSMRAMRVNPVDALRSE